MLPVFFYFLYTLSKYYSTLTSAVTTPGLVKLAGKILRIVYASVNLITSSQIFVKTSHNA